MSSDGEAFRTKITYRLWNGTTETLFEGPYAAVAPAKVRILWAERIYKNRLIEAVVERTSTNWEPVT